MPIEYDARLQFLPCGQSPIVIGVKPPENFLMGLRTCVILKYLHFQARVVIVPKTGGDLDFLMNGIVMPDESADKTNHHRQWL